MILMPPAVCGVLRLPLRSVPSGWWFIIAGRQTPVPPYSICPTILLNASAFSAAWPWWQLLKKE